MMEVDDTPIEQIIGGNPHKLLDFEADCLEGEISKTELANALEI